MIAYNIHNANQVQRQESPLEPGVWLMPGQCTDVEPPEFDSETHTCKFNGTEWVVELIPVKEEEPTPESIPAMELLRMERDSKLAQSDWRVNTDYPYDDQEAWKTYREELRQLPQQIEAGVIPAPTLNENYQLVFDNWPTEPS
jgi:hypothetical protein